jgi:hypothetical protein
MQEKQKVTLYFPAELYHQFKIRAAIDQEPMSELAERAISFYLSHADIVHASGVGHLHQVYNCPACNQTVVIREGELLAIGGNSRSDRKISSSTDLISHESNAHESSANEAGEELIHCS